MKNTSAFTFHIPSRAFTARTGPNKSVNLKDWLLILFVLGQRSSWRLFVEFPVPPDKMTVTIKLFFSSLFFPTPRGDWGALAAQFAAAEFQHVPLRVSPTPGVFYSSIPLSPRACISSLAPGFYTPSTTQCPISRLWLLIDFDEIDKRVSLFVSTTPHGPPHPSQTPPL